MKEIREKSEAKFKPEINKKSREIADRIMTSKLVNKDSIIEGNKNYRKHVSKSIEYVKRSYPEENSNVYFILIKEIRKT